MKIDKASPLYPTAIAKEDALAIQALYTGTATEGQQQRALNFIINELCLTYDQPYRPWSDRETTFACGKMHVGQELVRLTKLKIGVVYGTTDIK